MLIASEVIHMETTPLQVPFLPSLGMVWRGMWGLAYVPTAADDAADNETSNAA
ncbi:MAG TPA: hypothetical protein VM470_02185 [Acidimicrobiia bacterium]|nr:hypothetical protein [Acidimicrobiia bacterium]